MTTPNPFSLVSPKLSEQEYFGLTKGLSDLTQRAFHNLRKFANKYQEKKGNSSEAYSQIVEVGEIWDNEYPEVCRAFRSDHEIIARAARKISAKLIALVEFITQRYGTSDGDKFKEGDHKISGNTERAKTKIEEVNKLLDELAILKQTEKEKKKKEEKRKKKKKKANNHSVDSQNSNSDEEGDDNMPSNTPSNTSNTQSSNGNQPQPSKESKDEDRGSSTSAESINRYTKATIESLERMNTQVEEAIAGLDSIDDLQQEYLDDFPEVSETSSTSFPEDATAALDTAPKILPKQEKSVSVIHGLGSTNVFVEQNDDISWKAHALLSGAPPTKVAFRVGNQFIQPGYGLGPTKFEWNLRMTTFKLPFTKSAVWIFDYRDGVYRTWQSRGACLSMQNSDPKARGSPEDYETFYFTQAFTPHSDKLYGQVFIRNSAQGYYNAEAKAFFVKPKNGTPITPE